MAETLVVQRGVVATHNMHIEPGELPSSLWAKLQAQNAGYIAGNWQNHLVCTSQTSAPLEVNNPDFWTRQQVTQWRFRWPRLGSFSRLSFNALADHFPVAGVPTDMDFYVRFWNAGYNTVFYNGTVTEDFIDNEEKRITIEWDMDGAGLAAYLNSSIYIELLARRTVSSSIDNSWEFHFDQFAMYTANCPL